MGDYPPIPEHLLKRANAARQAALAARGATPQVVRVVPPDVSPETVEILDQLAEARRRGVTVMIDNDQISGYDEADYTKVVDCHPADLIEALLTFAGVKWEHV